MPISTTTVRPFHSLILVLSVLFLFRASDIKAQDSNASARDATQQESSYLEAISDLQQVNRKYVCMINNTLFRKKQIPVPIDEKTYYGCCQMCVSKLNENPESRFAIDPVSGERVNKAEAVIGATPDSTVYYFESVANMKKFELQSKDEKDTDA